MLVGYLLGTILQNQGQQMKYLGPGEAEEFLHPTLIQCIEKWKYLHYLEEPFSFYHRLKGRVFETDKGRLITSLKPGVNWSLSFN